MLYDINCPAGDQRGVTRPLDGDGNGSAICDIGAYEFENTPAESNVVVQLEDAGTGETVVELTFAQVSQPGTSSLTTSETGPAIPDGFSLGDPPTYYNITTTATYNPPITTCVTYVPGQYSNVNNLSLLHYENDIWMDVTVSNDTINSIICGETSGLSPFVVAETAGVVLSSLDPAQIWIGLKNSDDVGIKFDLMAEAYVDSNLISSGALDSVPGGGSGFNNSNLQSIDFDLFSPIDFPSGFTLSIKVYARNACVGSNKNSGGARLWYNDSVANSKFGTTIAGNQTDRYLIENFELGTNFGDGPKEKADVAAGAKCSPFKLFGAWSVTP